MTDVDRPANIAPSAFAGTAEDYARYRPQYPGALVHHLLGQLESRGRLLDLACGPGRIANALASQFMEVWALDSEAEMVRLGQTLAIEQQISNVRWLQGRAEELEAPEGAFDLITIGDAFHRLDRQRVLDLAMRWLKPGGWLASMGSRGVLSGSEPWQRAIAGLAEEWTRDVFPQGWATSRPGSVAGPEAEAQAMRSAGFKDVQSHAFVEPHTWTLDEIAGYLRSTSVCSRRLLGDAGPGFERALSDTLRALNPSEQFSESLEFGYTAGRRP